MSAKTAFVTGGTGFLGINLINILVEEGWKVTALHRPSSNLTYLKRLPSVSLAIGSINDKESLLKAIPDGTDTVFHVAGDISMWSKNDARQDRINIEGTRTMVEAAAEKKVKNFIYTSSTSTWGRVKGTITEETPKQGDKSWVHYEQSKYYAHKEALKGMDLGMKVVSLCPGDIIGPYDKASYGRAFFLMKDGKIPVCTTGRCTTTHVVEVAKAHVSAVTNGQNGASYILGGEDDFGELLDYIAVLVGAPKPKRVPRWLRMVAAYITVAVSSVTGEEPDDTPETVEITTMTGIHWKSDKAVKELGYKVVPMKTAVKDSFDWLVKEGLMEVKKERRMSTGGVDNAKNMQMLSQFFTMLVVVLLAAIIFKLKG